MEAANGRTYNGMRMVNRFDQKMIYQERIGVSDVFASYSCAPSIYINRDGTILGGASTGTLTRFFFRDQVVFGSGVGGEPPRDVYKIVSDHEDQSKPIGRLSMGPNANWYLIGEGAITKAGEPEISLVIPGGFSVVVDKDESRFVAIGAKIEDNRMGIQSAGDDIIVRRAVLYDRLGKALTLARKRLGVKSP